MKNTSDAYLIYKWQQCEEMAKALKFKLHTNTEIISIIDNGKFLYNATTILEVYAYLDAVTYMKHNS